MINDISFYFLSIKPIKQGNPKRQKTSSAPSSPPSSSGDDGDSDWVPDKERGAKPGTKKKSTGRASRDGGSGKD